MSESRVPLLANEEAARRARSLGLSAPYAELSVFRILLQSLAVPLEEGVDAWPPDGQAPR